MKKKIKSIIGLIVGILLMVACFIYLRPWNKIVGGICLFVVALITIFYLIDLLPARKKKQRIMNDKEQELFELERKFKSKEISESEYNKKRRKLFGIKEVKKK